MKKNKNQIFFLGTNLPLKKCMTHYIHINTFYTLKNDLVVGNTCFRKCYQQFQQPQIDYILYRKSFRKAVNDVKVIPTEECVQQPNLLICDFTVCIPSAKKCKFTPRICTWKLRDPAVSKDFQGTFKDKVAALTPVESADDVLDVWSKLKAPLLETVSKVFGLSKKHQWKRETWWWDDKVEEAVKKKRECFKRHIALAKAGQTREAEDAKVAYNEAKRLAKRMVWQAKSVAEREKFSNIAPNDTGIFKLAKQMDKTNQDVVVKKCVRNDASELSLSDE